MDKKTGAPKCDKAGNPVPKTSHTLNRVPCILYNNVCADAYTVKADNGQFGLSNVAATMVNLMGYAAPEMWNESMIEVN
jgi:2,3-bisphosphoglycerate-independent phosphoglycerate mutase